MTSGPEASTCHDPTYSRPDFTPVTLIVTTLPARTARTDGYSAPLLTSPAFGTTASKKTINIRALRMEGRRRIKKSTAGVEEPPQ